MQTRDNPLFKELPYNPVKGQILTAIAEQYSLTNIINQGVFILPVRPGLIRIGATYSWHDLDWQTTDDGRQFLESKVSEILKIPYQVVAQQAGIRPSTKDPAAVYWLASGLPDGGYLRGYGNQRRFAGSVSG